MIVDEKRGSSEVEWSFSFNKINRYFSIEVKYAGNGC